MPDVLLRQPPAESRVHLKELLSVAAGGVVFTTLHKFFPEEKGDRHPTLSERRNIVVIADEAHRSQYDFIDGYARHMRDDKGRALGIADAARLLEELPNKIRDLLGILVEVNLRTEAGLDYLEVVTPAFPSPISYRGHYYQRSAAQRQHLAGAEGRGARSVSVGTLRPNLGWRADSGSRRAESVEVCDQALS